MSPQRSNRDRLVEGALRCLERLPPEQITARVIAGESGANIASITYHFGSKEELLTTAVVEGLDRWLDEIRNTLGDVAELDPPTRFRHAAAAVDGTRRAHSGLARSFVGALARAQHDSRVRALLIDGFRRSRRDVADVLGLGSDQAGDDAGGLVLAMFNGLLFQSLLDPDLVIEGERLVGALDRLSCAVGVPTPQRHTGTHDR